MMMQWMGIALIGWFGILSPVLRSGHANTQKLVLLASGLIRVAARFDPAMPFTPPLTTVGSNALVMIVCLVASVGVEMPAIPSFGKLSNVGKVGSVCALITALQLGPIIFTPAKHMASFGGDLDALHPDVKTLMLLVTSVWGIMGAGGVSMRLAAILGGDEASMNAVNRGTVMLYSVMLGYMACMKTAKPDFDGNRMTTQMGVFFVYMMAHHFAQIADEKKKKK